MHMIGIGVGQKRWKKKLIKMCQVAFVTANFNWLTLQFSSDGNHFVYLHVRMNILKQTTVSYKHNVAAHRKMHTRTSAIHLTYQ